MRILKLRSKQWSHIGRDCLILVEDSLTIHEIFIMESHQQLLVDYSFNHVQKLSESLFVQTKQTYEGNTCKFV